MERGREAGQAFDGDGDTTREVGALGGKEQELGEKRRGMVYVRSVLIHCPYDIEEESDGATCCPGTKH